MPKSIENTVFVRFVPAPLHKVMRHQLEDIFSQIGPIKKSSWINAKAASTAGSSRDEGSTSNATSSKGYGFVKYVAQDDAETAMKELHNSKIQMEGQDYALKVELASLSSTKGDAPSQAVAPKTNKGTQHVVSMDLRRSEATSGSKSVGTKEEDSLLLKKKSRIILRNLSFYAKETHVRNAMETRFGKVLEVHVPNVQGNLHVGFCFVTFEDPKDAQKAVEARNIDISKRTVNIDWSLPKKLHQQQKQQKVQTSPKPHFDDEGEKNYVDDDHDEGGGDNEENGDASDNENVHDNDSEDGSNHLDEEENDNTKEAMDDDSIDKNSDDDDNDNDNDIHEETTDDSVGRKCTLFLRNLPFDTTRHDLFQLFLKFGHIKGIYLVKERETGMLKGTAFVTFSKAESASRAMDHAAMSSATEGVNAFVSQRQGAVSSNATGDDGIHSKGSLLLKGRKVLVDLAVDKETAATFDSQEGKIPSADRRNLYLQAEARVESSSTDPKADNANTWDDLPLQDQKKRQTALKDKTTKLQSPIFFINPLRLSFRNMGKDVDELGLQKLIGQAVTHGLEKRLVGAKDQIAHWRALGDMSTRDILAKVQTMEANGEEVIPEWDDKKNIKEYVPSIFIDRDFGPTGKKSDAPSRGFGFAEFTHHAHALACLRELNNNPAYSRDYAAGGKSADAIKKKSCKVKKQGGKGGAGGSGGEYLGEDGRVHVPRLIVDFTVENKIKAKKQAERRLHQQLNQSKQQLERLEKKETHSQKEENSDQKKRSRGSLQREKKRVRRESGEEEAERKAKLEAKALVEAKKALRKQRQEQKQKKMEEIKRKTVKAPKKKQTMDVEDEKFESIVRSYTAQIESTREEKEDQQNKNPRVVVKEKRWFE